MKTLKVIKIGSEIVDDNNQLNQFLADFSKLEGPKILVHGGGKLATHMANALNIPVKMVDGRRLTDTKTLEVATMVYAGQINKTIVAKLQQEHCNALGLSGADANVITSIKRPVTSIDYGFVGDIVKIDNAVISLLLNRDITPVFCAITHDKHGQLLNTNADTIANALATVLSSDFKSELYYCFNLPGVLEDLNDETSVITKIDALNYKELKHKGIISDGMIPKLDNCFEALANGVEKVCIGNSDLLKPKQQHFTTITT